MPAIMRRMRERSSARCSMKDMRSMPASSSSSPPPGGGGGIGVIRAVGALVVAAFVRRVIVIVGVVLILIGDFLELLQIRFLLQGFHFAVEARFELIRRASEFGHGLPDRPPQLRQLL